MQEVEEMLIKVKLRHGFECDNGFAFCFSFVVCVRCGFSKDFTLQNIFIKNKMKTIQSKNFFVKQKKLSKLDI